MTPERARCSPTTSHTVSVPLSASVERRRIARRRAAGRWRAALLAGSFGSWRIGRLRPADALAKVG